MYFTQNVILSVRHGLYITRGRCRTVITALILSLNSASFPTDSSPTVHHSILHHQLPPSGTQAYDTLSLESSDSLETSVSTGNSACTPERWETALFPWEQPSLPPLFEEKVTRLCSCHSGLCYTLCSRDGAGCCHAKPIQVFEVKFSLVLMKSPRLFSLTCCSDSRHVCLRLPPISHPKPCHIHVINANFPCVTCSACGLEAQRIEEMEKMLKEAQQEKARLIENRVSSPR